eukprot:scaffold2088_cov399-Prasinococcus_capsulatus_cf.AAC.48
MSRPSDRPGPTGVWGPSAQESVNAVEPAGGVLAGGTSWVRCQSSEEIACVLLSLKADIGEAGCRRS